MADCRRDARVLLLEVCVGTDDALAFTGEGIDYLHRKTPLKRAVFLCLGCPSCENRKCCEYQRPNSRTDDSATTTKLEALMKASKSPEAATLRRLTEGESEDDDLPVAA